MAYEPVPRKSAEVIRQEAISALDHAKAMVQPYLKEAGFFERSALRRRTRDEAFELELRAYLERLDAVRRRVLAGDELEHLATLTLYLVVRRSEVEKAIQELAMSDNAFAEDATEHTLMLWKRGIDRILSRYGF